MVDLLAEAATIGAGPGPAALATVIHTSGSTPRHPGARMIVRGDGSLVGTIGGGKIELEVVAAAREVTRGGPPVRLVKHLVQDLAMCCGGSMELWIEPLDVPRARVLAEVVRRRAARTPCALVTWLDERGLEAVDAPPGLRAPALEGERFVEPILPEERLVLFGAGHVAQAVAECAARVGFRLVICDEDERFASPARFPAAQVLLHTFDAREVARALAPFGFADYVVILTRDHAVDQQILEQLIERAELTYLGLIGSRGKRGRFRRRLDAKSIGDDAAWARLHSPVGLDLGAETPEEIAVAVVAELLQTRHGRTGGGPVT